MFDSKTNLSDMLWISMGIYHTTLSHMFDEREDGLLNLDTWNKNLNLKRVDVH